MQVLINGTEYVPLPFRPAETLPLSTLMARARGERRLNLKQAAHGSGVSLSSVHKAESGHGISLLTAIKLCRFYQIDLDTLADSVLAFEKVKGK